MNLAHKDLAGGRWFEFSLLEQMANIGSEIFRTISWRDKNKDYQQKAFERSLELFDFTVLDPKNRKRLKEILRARELWADYIYGGNQYNQTDILWQNYFYAFNRPARNPHGSSGRPGGRGWASDGPSRGV
ncbi:MAG: hypothetical protein A2216_01145 [Omnitrophica WOR_2 bacterium RIFOXYA2_FULL_45_12]|nr:MAG: hypothetical protein A2216_01145 [Omnitrophica WOR_2 bacterium RIFOXYA2_FULL_45_12]